MVFLPVFLLVLPGLYGNELGLHVTAEYNRAFYFCGDISAVCTIKTDNPHTIRGGIALGNAGRELEIKAFSGAELRLVQSLPLYAGLAYTYNGLPGYASNIHAILPLVSLKGRRGEFSLGTNMRFTSFHDGSCVFEPLLSFCGHLFFINNDALRLGLKAANFSDFTPGNMGAYFLALSSLTRLNRILSLVNEIEIRQSGSVALAANFYGLVYRGAVVFSW